MSDIIRSHDYNSILATPATARITKGKGKILGSIVAVAFEDEVALTEGVYITECPNIKVKKDVSGSGSTITALAKAGLNAATGNFRAYQSGDHAAGYFLEAAAEATTDVKLNLQQEL